jgi:phosphatidylglycerol:prolipoprotein diacylglycerol transferase
MILALAVFFAARRVQPQPPVLIQLGHRQRHALALAGFIGGAMGAKLPFLGAGGGDWLAGVWLRDGKTIMTGLVGAYLGVELAKVALGIRFKTGDAFALPLALALAVGRWGCFFNGCCYGLPTKAPWGIDFGDGIQRHPTQIYESLFHLGMALVLCRLVRRDVWTNHRLQFYLVTYCAYRFLSEWIRPEPAMLARLTLYQLIAIIFAVGLLVQWWLESHRAVSAPPLRAFGSNGDRHLEDSEPVPISSERS